MYTIPVLFNSFVNVNDKANVDEIVISSSFVAVTSNSTFVDDNFVDFSVFYRSSNSVYKQSTDFVLASGNGTVYTMDPLQRKEIVLVNYRAANIIFYDAATTIPTQTWIG